MSLIISASAFGSIAREVEYVDHMKNRHLEKVGKHLGDCCNDASKR